MKLNEKNWSCPKKQQARLETILVQYRLHFGNAVPADKQYWTICGQCADPDGEPLNGCEIWQLLEDGLIEPGQFHGVEINPAIHELNVRAFPEINWHHDDFYRAMVAAQDRGEFNPAVVNADLPKTPDGGAAYISKVMALLTATTKEVMLVVNLITKSRYYPSKDGGYIIERMSKMPQFKYAVAEGKWDWGNQYYFYKGSGLKSKTHMATIVFIKK